MKVSKINLLSSDKYNYLKQNMLEKCNDFVSVEIETKTFPDGEHYWKIADSEKLHGKPAVYICGTVDDNAIFEAYNMACTLVREQCSSLHLIVPYFGYSTMERAVKSGEVVTAKNIARMFSSLPLSAMGNYIYLVDLHSLGTQYYFEENLHPIHLTSEPVIDKIIADIRKQSSYMVLASADMGRAKWIEKMSNRLNMPGAYIMKRRISGSETEVEALNADVKDCDIIIFDDMIRSGSSIINAAKAYKSIGAKDVYVVCVHGVFTQNSLQNLRNSGVIKQVYCTNTHPNALANAGDFLKVYDISEILLHNLKI